MTIYVRRVGWLDVNGNVRTTATTGVASMSTLQIAVANASNADYATESEAQIFVNALPLPVNATYKNVEDAATLWFTTASGTIISMNVPAPRAAIFMVDQETVDPANVVGIITAAIGVLSTLSGDVATAFLGGIRTRL